MKTISIEVYNVKELNPLIVRCLLEKTMSNLYENLDSDYVTELLNGFIANKLNSCGLDPISSKEFFDIYGLTAHWSLSHSQGDGVSVIGNLTPSIYTNFDWDVIDELRMESTNNRYVHEHSFDISFVQYDRDGWVSIVPKGCHTKICFLLTNSIRNICIEASKYGYDLIDDMTDEGMAMLTLEEMGEVFDIQGNVVRSYFDLEILPEEEV